MSKAASVLYNPILFPASWYSPSAFSKPNLDRQVASGSSAFSPPKSSAVVGSAFNFPPLFPALAPAFAVAQDSSAFSEPVRKNPPNSPATRDALDYATLQVADKSAPFFTATYSNSTAAKSALFSATSLDSADYFSATSTLFSATSPQTAPNSATTDSPSIQVFLHNKSKKVHC